MTGGLETFFAIFSGDDGVFGHVLFLRVVGEAFVVDGGLCVLASLGDLVLPVFFIFVDEVLDLETDARLD